LTCTQAPGDFHQRSGCVGLAKSDNLLDWKLVDPLWKWSSAMHADCPQLLKEGDLWYLFTLDRNGRYRIADSSFGPWRRPPRRDLMLNPLFAMSRPAWDGKRWVTFPFICGRQGNNDFADLINAEVLAIPRQLGFHKDGSVTDRVIPELLKAIHEKPALEGKILAAAKPITGQWSVGKTGAASAKTGTCNLLRLPGMPDSFYFEVDVTLERKAMDAVIFFRAEPNLSAAYQIDLQPEEGLIVFRPCNDWDNRQVLVTRAHPLPVGRPFKVRLFVSGTVMEVFIDDQLSLSHRVYARARGDMFLETRDGTAAFANIKIRKLQGDVKL
jgi:beta-fructofuranosidase